MMHGGNGLNGFVPPGGIVDGSVTGTGIGADIAFHLDAHDGSPDAGNRRRRMNTDVFVLKNGGKPSGQERYGTFLFNFGNVECHPGVILDLNNTVITDFDDAGCFFTGDNPVAVPDLISDFRRLFINCNVTFDIDDMTVYLALSDLWKC